MECNLVRGRTEGRWERRRRRERHGELMTLGLW